jgi:flagellin
MAINDISLTAGMRSNLVNLQSTVSLLNRTQERLASGKKVNSALDNPTSFFTAQALSQRASDLSGLKDTMSNAVQTIQAANRGISSITTLIEAAKGIANSALSTTNTTTVYSYAQQFDTIMTQINKLSQDANYNGSNLLYGASGVTADTLTVKFDLTSGNSLSVTGGLTATGTALTTGALNLTAASTAGGNAWSVAGATAITAANITASLNTLATAETTMQTASASLSANLTIINTRQDFTGLMINNLTTGADTLTLADMNEEGANMLMLQTRNSLSVTALSLSSQAAQSVLKLF